MSMRMEDLAQTVIADRFRLEEMVGKGGYGAVFSAVQLSVDRRCAVKILLPARSTDESVEERFRAEARATSRLTHPNSVVLYDFGVDEETGFLFLATEFLDGFTLHDVLEVRKSLDLGTTLSIMKQIAASLDDAHSKGLIHRDIKPKNIMLVERAGRDDFVKVIDFGIAKALSAEQGEENGLTRTGMLVGTPQYMSPEQLLGGSLDGRADQYALATMGYRMLTGRNPFRAGAAMETAMRHVNDRPLPLRTYRPDLEVSAQFEDVFLKALEKSAEYRFDGVVDFVDALVDAAEQAPWGIGESSKPLMPAPEQCQTMVLDAVGGDEGDDTGAATVGARPKSNQRLIEEGDDETYTAGQETMAARPSRLGAGEDNFESRCKLKSEAGAFSSVIVDESTESGVPESRPSENRSSTDTQSTTVANTPRATKPGTETSPTRRESAVTTSNVSRSGAKLVPATWVLAVVAGSALFFCGGLFSVLVVGNLGQGGGELTASETAPHSPSSEKNDKIHGGDDSTEVISQTERTDNNRPAVGHASSEAIDQIFAAQSLAEEHADGEGQRRAAAEATEDREKPQRSQPQPETGPATVTVTLIPWGTLYVDGRPISDATRQQIELPAGSHELTLRQNGQTQARRVVDVQPAQSKIVVLEADFYSR